MRLGWMLAPVVAGVAADLREGDRGRRLGGHRPARAVRLHRARRARPARAAHAAALRSSRREALLEALARWLPQGRPSGAGAAGLFELVRLPEQVDEPALLQRPRRAASASRAWRWHRFSHGDRRASARLRQPLRAGDRARRAPDRAGARERMTRRGTARAAGPRIGYSVRRALTGPPPSITKAISCEP